jgi:hypothetical protein
MLINYLLLQLLVAVIAVESQNEIFTSVIQKMNLLLVN